MPWPLKIYDSLTAKELSKKFVPYNPPHKEEKGEIKEPTKKPPLNAIEGLEV